MGAIVVALFILTILLVIKHKDVSQKMNEEFREKFLHTYAQMAITILTNPLVAFFFFVFIAVLAIKALA